MRGTIIFGVLIVVVSFGLAILLNAVLDPTQTENLLP